MDQHRAAGQDRLLEWPAAIDVDALLSAGWQPQPFRQFCLKLHSRCNLACSYCYIYTMADSRWHSRPRVMTSGIIDQVAFRVAEHVHTHNLPSIEIILHGGEPLLAGLALIRYAVTRIRHAVGSSVGVRFNIQTNAVLLDKSFLRLFDELDVGVSVSLDGDRAAHDRMRQFRGGRGSHSAVEAALRNLTAPPYRRLFSGLLCTIDLRNDPVATYEALIEFAPPAVDFLLPQGNWSAPPAGRDPDSHAAPYADWLIAVFERWMRAPRQETVVRLFEALMNVLVGKPSPTEGVGLTPVCLAVVETDGAIEQSDMLAAAYHGAGITNLDVMHDSFGAALLSPGMVARQIGIDALSAQCRACTLSRVCGGGLYPHRYRKASGFANPSVYCPDLYRLITHVKSRVESYLVPLGGQR